MIPSGMARGGRRRERVRDAGPDGSQHRLVQRLRVGRARRDRRALRRRTDQFRNVEVWPMSTGGWPAEDLRYRFQWTFPLLISPHDTRRST